jgi:hypothetical protein
MDLNVETLGDMDAKIYSNNPENKFEQRTTQRSPVPCLSLMLLSSTDGRRKLTEEELKLGIHVNTDRHLEM